MALVLGGGVCEGRGGELRWMRGGEGGECEGSARGGRGKEGEGRGGEGK